MNETEYIAKTVHEHLDRCLPVVLISLLNLKGSTPRHEGSKMIVGSDGKPYGTIGGSLLEATSIEKAREVLEARQSRLVTFELTGEDTSDPGMICGGKTEVLLDYLAPTPENRLFARQWYENISSGTDGYLCTCLKRNSSSVTINGRVIVADNQVTGTLPDGVELSHLKEEFRSVSSGAVRSIKGNEILIEPVKRLKTLYCFGAGHVAVPTAHMAALAGFRVVVVDDRPEFASEERFPEARRVLVIDDFNKAMSELPVDEDSFIVIVTRGHQYDRVVLEQALKTKASYIGMISSRKKRDAIYAALRESGVSQAELDNVHSPIGLDIGGETPEEIGVSIVAELIAVRNGRKS